MQRHPRSVHRFLAAVVAVVLGSAGASVASTGVSADETVIADDSEVEPLRASEALGYTSLNPERILDTRLDIGSAQGRLGENDSISLSVLGVAGVPNDGVDSVVLNVTAVNPSADRSFLTVWPRGTNRPTTSNLNFVRGQTVPNLVVVKVGVAGQIDLYNAVGDVDVLADVVGYHADTSDFTGLDPDRLLDTRTGIGAPTGKVGAGASIDLEVTGRGGVPSTGVGAVVLNVTAARTTAQSFVTVWPTGIERPKASNINFEAGANVPNLVIVKVGSGGSVSLYNDRGEVDLLADVVGYYLDGATYVGLTPDRILDTRTGVGAAAGKVGAGGDIGLNVLGVSGLPSEDVRAVVLNVTAAAPTTTSFITVWPSGSERPTASSLNMVGGKNVANLVIAKVGLDGKIAFYNNAGSTHIIADVVGYVDAAAGVDLPALDLPAANDWSAITWTVNRVELREQDGTSGTFRTNDADTPFILDVRIRAQNNSADRQTFRYSSVELDLGTGSPIEVINADRSTQFSLARGGADDIELAFPIGWTDDLANARIRFGGDNYEVGRVALSGPQPAAEVTAAVGVLPSGRSTTGLCNGTGNVDYVARTASWTNVLPTDVAVTGDDRAARQARSGTRWLVLEFDLTRQSNCSGNVTTGDFRLDVDSAFVEGATFINEIIGLGTNQLTVTAAFKVPVTATTVELAVVGAPPVTIPTSNLG